MINAKDLMIGDHINSSFGIAQVISIDKVGVTLINKDNGEFDIDFLDNDAWLQEILLTPEILEKNGFKKLVTYGTEKWIYGDIRMNIYSSNGCWRFCADTKRNENSVIYIHFIHELQHALRLCKIDKTIKL